MSSMPDGVENTSPEDQREAPLDGVVPPVQADESWNDIAPDAAQKNEIPETIPDIDADAKRRKILRIILGIAGALLLFYLFFAFFLLISLPDPAGGKQGLRLFGNIFYASACLLALAGISLLTLRMIRSGIEPDALPQALLRPGIGVIAILAIAIMVFFRVNQQTPLAVDVLEPKNLQGLTAPVTVTFGTDSLRSVLRNQGLVPRKYKWDFNGDGTTDAETEEPDVTTTYKRKGTYNVRLRMLLSNGKARNASARLSIPNAVFSLNPETLVRGEDVLFDASNLVADPEKIESIQWDFNGDGTAETVATLLETSYVFSEIGTFQVQALIQYKGGLQETYARTVTILEEREQPFDIAIEAEGTLKGSVPLGIIFTSTYEEGTNPRAITWRIAIAGDPRGPAGGEEKSGERISHVFSNPGEYRVILEVTDSRGRVATKTVTVNALEPLKINDIVISGNPKPVNGRAEGIAPLEVQLTASTNTPFITFSFEQENASTVYSVEESYRALYEDPGTFPVVLIAHDEQGRTQKIPIEITVQPPRSQVTFTAIPSTGIAPLNVTFDASESSVPDGRITGFAWTFGDGIDREEKPQLLGAKVTHRYEKEGTFTVTVRALTEDGRSFDARKTIVARTPALHACIFPSRTTGSAPMGVRFDGGCSTGKIDSYVWTFGDGATSEQTTAIQDHVFTKTGTYTVTLEIKDGKGNFDQTTVSITVQNP